MPDQKYYGDKYFNPEEPSNEETEGEKLEKSGEYIDTGELDNEGNPQLFEALQIAQSEGPHALNQSQQSLLINSGYDDFVRGGNTQSPVGDLATLAVSAVAAKPLAGLIAKDPVSAAGTALDIAFPPTMEEALLTPVVQKFRHAEIGKRLLRPIWEHGKPYVQSKLNQWFSSRRFATANGADSLDVVKNEPLQASGGLMTPGGQKHVLGERHRLFDNPSRVHRSGKYKSKLYELLNQQNLLGQAEEVLTNLDEYKTTQNFGGKYNPDRPTTGFKGNRTVEYIDSAGNPSEVGWRWSFTAGDYVPYDVQKRLALVARRSNWNVNRSSKSAQYANKIFSNAREQNQAVKEALENLRQENPEYFWKIMGENYDTTKGVVYVEHINPQKSPVWVKQPDGSFRHRVSGIAPRDAGNLVIVPGPEFGILKTKIESILYAPSRLEKGAGNYLDFDRKRRVLILRDVNGRRIGDISSITNPENAQKAIDAALRGHTIGKGIEGDWQEVIQADPKIPSHIDALDEITDWQGRF